MSASFSLAEILEATGGTPKGNLPSHFPSLSTDTRSLNHGALFLALTGENFDGHQYLHHAQRAGANGAVVQRGKILAAPAAELEGWGLVEVDDPLTALGKIARFHRRKFSIPVGAITGSNGKTTTKEMTGSILEKRGSALKTEGNLNNEIGVPLTLLRLDASHQAAIIEMGMSNPGELSRLSAMVEPRCALITVVSPAHLAGLGSVEAVAKAKGEIFGGLSPNGIAIANGDDPYARREAQAFAQESGRSVMLYGRCSDAQVQLIKISGPSDSGMEIVLLYQGQSFPIRLQFLGEHNAWNACGAFAMGVALGCSAQQCVQGLEDARPWKHRLNLLLSPQGFSILDDCYNANPSSSTAALDTLRSISPGKRTFAVLGDMLELGPEEENLHYKLGEHAIRTGVQGLVAFGPRSRAIFDAVRTTLGPNTIHVSDPAHRPAHRIEEVVSFLEQRMEKGDVVLVKGSRGMKLERVVELLMTGELVPQKGIF